MFQVYTTRETYALNNKRAFAIVLFMFNLMFLPLLTSAQQVPASCQFLSRVGGALSVKGAEIPVFHPASDRVYTVAGPVIEYFTMAATGTLTYGGELPFGFTPPLGNTGIPNSVAVYNNILAASYAVVNSTTRAQQPGRVTFYDATTGAVLNSIIVGYLPDMIAFTADGTRLVTANEGEPNNYNQPTSFDPEGSVSIINISGGIASATVQTASFTSYNSQMATLRASGVRIYGPNATVAQDLEPEYVAFSPDGLTVWVTLQENNAFALIDIASATVTSIIPLGLKNHNLAGKGLDASDRDGLINIQNWPVFGMYQPDAIAQFSSGGQAYYITANEGDARDYTGYSEEVRVGAAAYVLDPATFSNTATLKLAQNLGRLNVTSATGNTDGDTDYDQIHVFGSRSFSIWNSSGSLIYDSGDQLEQITAAATPTLFNSDGTSATYDTRSDNKGPEPEGVAVGVINGIPYAFIGLERIGDIMVYNVSNPAAPVFIQYVNVPEDFGVEGLSFVPAANSPTGKPLLIATAEVSRTISIFEVNIPVISVSENSGLANNDGVICAGASVTLTASGSGPYLWSNGATTASITVTPNSTTTYTVTTCSLTDDQTITVNPLPACSITAVPANNVFTGGIATNIYLGYGPQSVTLQTAIPSSGAPFSYAWSGGALSNISVANPVFTATTPGVFTFTVTITNAFGCSSSCSITITVTDIRDGNKNKVFICHKGHSQSVSVNAVPAHLAHGDQLGNCDAGRSTNMITLKAEQSLVPNPAGNFVNVSLEGHEGEILITVRDINNRIVLPVVKQNAHAAKSTIRLNTSSLINGTYFVRATSANGKSQSFKLLIVH